MFLLCITVVSRKRAQYQISTHPPLSLQFHSKKRPPNWPRAESFRMRHDARLVYSYTKYNIQSHCGSFWKIMLSFPTWLGLSVKFITWNFKSFSWGLERCHLSTYVKPHMLEMQTLNWIKLVLGRCVGVQYPVVCCDNVNMGTFSWWNAAVLQISAHLPVWAQSIVHHPWALFPRLR